MNCSHQLRPRVTPQMSLKVSSMPRNSDTAVMTRKIKPMDPSVPLLAFLPNRGSAPPPGSGGCPRWRAGATAGTLFVADGSAAARRPGTDLLGCHPPGNSWGQVRGSRCGGRGIGWRCSRRGATLEAAFFHEPAQLRLLVRVEQIAGDAQGHRQQGNQREQGGKGQGRGADKATMPNELPVTSAQKCTNRSSRPSS